MPARQNSKQILDYLDTIGTTDRGDDLPLGNCAKALTELAGFLIEKATENLDKRGNTATGGTATSMRARDIVVNGTQYELDIEIASNYKFLNDGVKGTEGGTGKYQFKTKYPGKKMALAILKWIRVRRIASKYKAKSAGERKNQRIKRMSAKADSQKSLAYAMATNIKKKGIKPTYFFSGKNFSAVEATKQEQKKLYAEAFKLDIIESLNDLN